MFGIFSMLVQNFTNMGFVISECECRQNYANIEFTDADGNKYSGWVRKEKKEENENA